MEVEGLKEAASGLRVFVGNSGDGGQAGLLWGWARATAAICSFCDVAAALLLGQVHDDTSNRCAESETWNIQALSFASNPLEFKPANGALPSEPSFLEVTLKCAGKVVERSLTLAKPYRPWMQTFRSSMTSSLTRFAGCFY